MIYCTFDQCFICKYHQRQKKYLNIFDIMIINNNNISIPSNNDDSFINFDQSFMWIGQSHNEESSSSFIIYFGSNLNTVVIDDSSHEYDSLPNIIDAKKMQ